MRVNITYRVEMNEIPETVSDLLDKVQIKIEGETYKLDDCALRLRDRRAPINDIIERISKFREVLAQEDAKLEDYCFMLAQHQKTEAEIYLAQQESQQQKNMTEMPKEDFQKLYDEQLEKMKEEAEEIKNVEDNRNI